MTLEQAIELLRKEYERAKNMPHWEWNESMWNERKGEQK